jgi:two-component system, chemotaxis family, protein-glutamate methylesterase/glutaminase
MCKLKVAIIGSSGAGLPILNSIFRNMPKLRGVIILIQHMPVYINESVRNNLAAHTRMTVKLAEQDEILRPGFLYVAPSELHLKIVSNERIQLSGGEKVNYVCPSIDVAMTSLTPDSAVRVMGILLSGIGDDGVEGIGHIKQIGGETIALEKKTTTIGGMADEAVATGRVDFVLNPAQIREALIGHLGEEPEKPGHSERRSRKQG